MWLSRPHHHPVAVEGRDYAIGGINVDAVEAEVLGQQIVGVGVLASHEPELTAMARGHAARLVEIETDNCAGIPRAVAGVAELPGVDAKDDRGTPGRSGRPPQDRSGVVAARATARQRCCCRCGDRHPHAQKAPPAHAKQLRTAPRSRRKRSPSCPSTNAPVHARRARVSVPVVVPSSSAQDAIYALHVSGR
jgi:hypothetical protein